MKNHNPLLIAAVRDFIIIGITGGVLSGGIWGESFGISVLCGCLWLALNFSALAWLLSAISGPRPVSKLFLFILACAKIPASYLLLYGLYAVEYLDKTGLTVGVATLPVVLLFRGLKTQPDSAMQEEG